MLLSWLDVAITFLLMLKLPHILIFIILFNIQNLRKVQMDVSLKQLLGVTI